MKTNTPRFANLRTNEDLRKDMKKLRSGEKKQSIRSYNNVEVVIEYSNNEYNCKHYIIYFDGASLRDEDTYTTIKAVGNFISNRM